MLKRILIAFVALFLGLGAQAQSDPTVMVPGANSNLNGYMPFAGSAWYTDISAFPVNTTLDTQWRAQIGAEMLHPDFCNSLSLSCGMPFNIIDTSDDTAIKYYRTDSGDTDVSFGSMDTVVPYKDTEVMENNVAG
jgi:hypothetical protein